METDNYNYNDSFNPNSVRLVALREIDTVRFSRFHLKAVLVAGAGFFTHAYDLFTITTVVLMLQLVYDNGADVNTIDRVSLGIKIATPLGNLLGQLLFGWLADQVGRKRMYGLELIIMICSTFTQALAVQGPSVTITGALILWRLCMGVGIGGDYPLSAVITAEFASVSIRGRMMTAVFAMQGFGNLTAAIVATVVTSAYQSEIVAAGSPGADSCWRLLIGFGCVPAVLALYVRLTIPETPRWTMDVKRSVEKGATDVDLFLMKSTHQGTGTGFQPPEVSRARQDSFFTYFSQWKNGKVLMGTAYSWFVTDVAFYGLSFNSNIVLYSIFTGIPLTGDNAAYAKLYDASVANIILALSGLIRLLDRWGRKPIQYMGFAILTIIFISMSAAFAALQNTSTSDSTPAESTMQPAFVVLWCIANFFLNFGPNTTTFIVPAEAFPTRFRATAHGVSAACGKFGSIIAQLLVWKLGGRTESYRVLLGIFAVFMFSGLFSTWLLPKTNQKTLEAVSSEPEEPLRAESPAPSMQKGAYAKVGYSSQLLPR